MALFRSGSLLRALVLASAVLPLLQACGRSEPGDYLFNSDGTISEGATSNTSAGSRATGGTRSSTGGTSSTGTAGSRPVGGSVAVGGGGPLPGGGHSGIGGTGVGGTGVGGTGVAGAPDVGGTGNVTPMSCGDEICNADTQSCCAGLAGLSCVSKNAECTGAVLGCTLQSDCAQNQVCCISITGDASAASSCRPSCNGGPTRDRQLCETDADCRPPLRFCTATVFGVSICTRR
jgi:hypothetical protein